MIKAEKDVTTVGIEVRDADGIDNVSITVVGKSSDVITATAWILAEVVRGVSSKMDFNENACLGMLCGMAAKIMEERGHSDQQRDKEETYVH